MPKEVEPTKYALHIGDMIPDTLRKNIDTTKSNGANLTGANYVTVSTDGAIQTPSGQNAGPDVDLNYIKTHFNNTLTSELQKDSTEINNSLLGNSVKTTVTDRLNFDTLTNRPFTINVNDLDEVNIFSNTQQLSTVLSIINQVAQGAKENRFFDADDADNLIEITPADAQQQGGLRARNGNDKIVGTQSNDIANGNAGNDTAIGAGGDDFLQGGQGSDLIDGGNNNDLVFGNSGDDTLIGGGGDDILRGGSGNDFLYGNAGNDILIGDAGSDFLVGGEGADEFILRGDANSFDAAYADRILDFNPSQGDRIKIANLKGVAGMDQILLASVDVNKDGLTDTAILCSCGDVIGVIMSTDPSNISVKNSILIAGPQDTTLSKIS
ncbi:MAG TPA: calcium-binding protein [Kamptonema sp.]|nr:calcium-binding protein [Kamptonema sp.]